MDLALVMDGNSVVRRADPDDWEQMLLFAQDVVSKFVLGSGHTRVAAIVYGDVRRVIFHLNTFNGRVRTRVCNLGSRGSSKTP